MNIIPKAYARNPALRVAYERGILGVDRPIYYRGKLIGKERVFSDRALEIILAHDEKERKQKKRKVMA